MIKYATHGKKLTFFIFYAFYLYSWTIIDILFYHFASMKNPRNISLPYICLIAYICMFWRVKKLKPKYFAKQVPSSVGHIYITFDKICIIVTTGNTRVQQWFMINIAHIYDQTNIICKKIGSSKIDYYCISSLISRSTRLFYIIVIAHIKEL